MTSCELRIRKMTFADLDDLYALLSDVEVMRFIEPPFQRKKRCNISWMPDCLKFLWSMLLRTAVPLLAM